MEYDNVSSAVNQDFSIQNQANGNLTLFDKNLNRINKNLKYVDQYYTPKYDLVENHSGMTKTEESDESLNDEIDKSINIFTEFHKIAMNEIESIRKAHVRKMLSGKANNWERIRRECFSKSRCKDKELISEVRERLSIFKNYGKELLDSNNDQLQNRLDEEKILIDQKKRNIKFGLVLNTAISLFYSIKKLLNESNKTSQSLGDQLHNCLLFETDLKKFEKMSRNSTENDLFELGKLIKNIKAFHEQILKNSCQKIENFSFKIDSNENEENKVTAENHTFKINENNEQSHNLENIASNINHKSEEPKKAIENFTFKIDKEPEVKLDNLSTFKFKMDEIVSNNDNILSFSFNTDSIKQKKTEDITTCYFENEYTTFLENHFTIQKHLKKSESLYSSFLQDDNQKNLRQELTKSIYTPINSISSVSSWHMKDKFDKLDSLLKCKTVKIGNSTVSVNSHKDALIFCKDTLAKKIISIAEQVASVKSETAFEVASIITELWQIHPDFGLLLFARFKQKCPSLIPYDASKTNEETDEEYYKSLGYNYTNGVVEKQENYLKRMTGIIRLFAAIIVTETRSGKALGIGQAWMIIAGTVHFIPQLDVSAVLLHEMLIITGYNLKQAYKKQFIKMLQYIDANYMTKIDEVTPVGCGGPVQRLKTFISRALQVGYIDKPKGIIPKHFW